MCEQIHAGRVDTESGGCSQDVGDGAGDEIKRGNFVVVQIARGEHGDGERGGGREEGGRECVRVRLTLAYEEG